MKTKIQTSKAAFIIDNAGFYGEIDFGINKDGLAELKRQVEKKGLITDRAAMDSYLRDVYQCMVIKSNHNRFEQSYYKHGVNVVWFIELDSDKHFDCYFYASEAEIDEIYKASIDKFYEKKGRKRACRSRSSPHVFVGWSAMKNKAAQQLAGMRKSKPARCAFCGKEFMAYGRALYDSDACKSKAWRGRLQAERLVARRLG